MDIALPSVTRLDSKFPRLSAALEEEWRLVDVSGTKEHMEVLMPCPSGIYLGSRMSSQNKDRVGLIRDQLSRENGVEVPVFTMKVSDRCYGMEPEIVTS